MPGIDLRKKTPPFLYRKLVGDDLLNLRSEKEAFLTFDDGPDPEVTPRILDLLNRFGAKATFFCIGSKAEKHPGILDQIREEGHQVGNHSYSHPAAWKTKNSDYLNDVEKCAGVFSSFLFRPPYGQLTPDLAKALKGKYRIILWNLLSFDYEAGVTVEKCSNYVLPYLKPGSVAVFHDRVPLGEKLEAVLPGVLEKGQRIGLTFSGLTEAHFREQTPRDNAPQES